MSYFLVMLYEDPEEYHFDNEEDAEDFILNSPNGGNWFEIISLNEIDSDLI